MVSLSLSEDSSVSSHLRERIANVHLNPKLSVKRVSLKQQERYEKENESTSKKAEKGGDIRSSCGQGFPS